jgi:hypothetical protein
MRFYGSEEDRSYYRRLLSSPKDISTSPALLTNDILPPPRMPGSKLSAAFVVTEW